MSGQSEQNIRAKAIETQGIIVRDKDKTWIVPNPKIRNKMEKNIWTHRSDPIGNWIVECLKNIKPQACSWQTGEKSKEEHTPHEPHNLYFGRYSRLDCCSAGRIGQNIGGEEGWLNVQTAELKLFPFVTTVQTADTTYGRIRFLKPPHE